MLSEAEEVLRNYTFAFQRGNEIFSKMATAMSHRGVRHAG